MDINSIRNIGIIAHIDAGKTTTSERILFYTGKSYKIGEVDEGTTVMDWMVQEQERGITITAAATTCFWKKADLNYQINMIDTPGHVDFTLEVERSLRVMDGAVVVMCAVAGVQPQTETVWRQADKFEIPRLVFINKTDRKGADYKKAIATLAEKTKCKPVLVSIPYKKDESVIGIVDLINNRLVLSQQDDMGKALEFTEIPSDIKNEATKARDSLCEAVSEFEDKILESLINEEVVDIGLLIKAIRKGCLTRKIVPVFCGAAFKNKGVQALLDGIADFLPSPMDVGAIKTKDTNGKEYQVVCEEDKLPVALLFKTQIDEHLGSLSYLRVYSGQLKAGVAYWNERLKKRERITKLYRTHAIKREIVDSIGAGDIATAAGLKESSAGDTLSTKELGIMLENIYIPQPVISVAVELKSASDQEKLDTFMSRLIKEDPSLKVTKDSESGQTLLYGMGELHLDIAANRITREAKIDIKIGRQQVSKRERPTKKVRLAEVFDKPIMGKPCFAELKIQMNLYENKEGTNKIDFRPELVCPPEVVEMINSGCKEALSSGVLIGSPVIETEIIVNEINIDESRYQPAGFKVAAALLVRKCLTAAECELLSPQMKIAVNIPAESVGATVSDLNQRNTKILSIEDLGEYQEISGLTPLENMLGYTTKLRSVTQGRGSFNMEFSHFSPL